MGKKKKNEKKRQQEGTRIGGSRRGKLRKGIYMRKSKKGDLDREKKNMDAS